MMEWAGLAAATVVLCAIVLAIGLGRGQPAELMVITAISLVVAAIPSRRPSWSPWRWPWAPGG